MITLDEFESQILPGFRKIFAASGPGTIILIKWGIPEADIDIYVEFVIALMPLIISIIWGMHTHTVDGKIAAVEKMSDVENIIIKDNASSKMESIVKDKNRDKVISVSQMHLSFIDKDE